MNAPLLAHLMPVEYEAASQRVWEPTVPGWLLRLPRVAGVARRLGDDACRWHRAANAWWAPGAPASFVMIEAELAVSPRTLVYCAECAEGEPCSAWDVDALADLGFLPVPLEDEPSPADDAVARATWERIEAWVTEQTRAWTASGAAKASGTVDLAASAALLGLAWPCSRDELTRGFRAAATRAHADHGGSDEAMKRVLAARAVLEKAMGAT